MENTPVILQILPELNTGGTEQSAVDLAIYLKSHDYLPLVASNGGSKVNILSKNRIHHLKLPLQRKSPWAIWANSRQLIKIIDDYNVTVLHARSRAPAWAAWLAHRARPNTKFITTFHGTYGAQNCLKRAYNRVMLKGPLVIANSLFIKQHIVKTYGYPAARIMVAQRGADPQVFDPHRFTVKSRAKLLKSLQIQSGQPRLTLIGRLTAWKGQQTFITALEQIKHLKWHALIVGGPANDNPYYQQLLRQVETAGLAGRVTFTGDRADVAELIDLSDLLFSCSTRPEAFGRVAVEAQMMGKPVIVTKLGGSIETVQNGRTGWLVAPDSPQALASTITGALTHKAATARLGARAKTWARGRFTTERCCAAETLAYKKLLMQK